MSQSGAHPNDKPVAASLGWRVVASRWLYQSQWYAVRQDDIVLPNGDEVAFTWVDHPGFVTVVPITAGGNVVLIRSYRYPVDAWGWELPAGGLGNKPGMTPEDVAREELREETGYEARGAFTLLGRHLDAIGNARMEAFVFLALDVVPAGSQHLDATEHIEVHELPFGEALALVDRGEMPDAASALALLMAARHLRRPGTDRVR